MSTPSFGYDHILEVEDYKHDESTSLASIVLSVGGKPWVAHNDANA